MRFKTRSFRSVFAYLAAVILSSCIATSVVAADKYRGGYNFNNYEVSRRQQAEMERLRREQEKAQQRQMREMERAQQRAQQGWGRSSPFQAPQQQVRDQAPTVKSQANSTSTRKEADKPSRSAGDGKLRPDDEDDTDDWTLTDTQRRLKSIARERQRELAVVKRESEAMLKREAARERRIRERSIRQSQKEIADIVNRAPVEGDGQGPLVVPTAAMTPAPPGKGTGRGWPRDASGIETRPSGLGMGRDAAKADPGGEPINAPHAGDADARAGKQPGASNGNKAETDDLPPVQSDQSQGSVMVSGMSADELEAAKAKGFAVSEDIDLKGSGVKVRRISARGFTDEELERAMHKMAPFSQSFPNFEYSIYMGTLGESEGALRKPTEASPQPCPDNACFGKQLIKWQQTLGACTKNVKIGIIDTSFDTDHPTFKRLRPIQGEFLGDKRPSQSDWHGTAVLSLLAGDPQSGTPGLVPDATFLLATAFRSDVNGNATTDTVNLLQALDWLEQLDVDIVNMSFSGPQDAALARAIDRMSKKGVVFIAAAGNMGPTASPSYPAAYPNVVAVTAVNRKGVSYKSANRGSYIDVSAPGVDILTALPNGKQGYRTGTSFAVPFVTAILAARASEHPRKGVAQDPLKDVEIVDLGPPGPDPIYGEGLALAPSRCISSGANFAQEKSAPGAVEGGGWSTRTTFMRAGAAGFGR